MICKTNHMKRIITVALLILTMGVSYGQRSSTPPAPPTPPTPPAAPEPGERGSRKEKIEAMKIAYLTNHLDLTPEEAQKFWPIYNQYEAKQMELRKMKKDERREANDNLEKMSDKDLEALVDNEIVMRQKELDLMKEYHKQFKTVLPVRKVAKLYRAEEMFRRELVKKIQDGRGR
jgi:Spy/CpxP family protein refolding chaperone